MQLEMFVAVVEEGSVRDAADRVFRTQPCGAYPEWLREQAR